MRRRLATLCIALAVAATARAQTKPSLADLARTILDASYPATWQHAKLFSRLDRACSEFAAHPLAETAVLRWAALANEPGVSQTAWKKLSALLDNPELHGLARHALRSSLERRAERRGKKLDPRTSPRADYAAQALAIGPFGDSGSMFHGVRFAPEFERVSLDATHDGRYGKVSWRLAEREPLRTAIDLAPETSNKRSGCQYGLIQADSAKAGPAWLQLSCAGSFEVWWNGAAAASVNRATTRGPLRRFLPVWIRSGWNRLLVKTTSQNSSMVSLRIVGQNGDVVPGLTFEAERKLHDVAARTPNEAAPGAFMTASRRLARSIDKETGGIVRALAGNLLAREGRSDLGVGLARRAIAKRGTDPTVRAACFETWRLARHLPADIRRNELRRLLDVDAPTWKNHRHLFRSRVRRLFADDKREEALRVLETRLAAHPNEVATLDEQYRVFSSMRWGGERRRTLEKLLLLAPRHVPYVLDMARLEDAEGNPTRALARVERALEDQPARTDLLGRALSLARKVGDRDRQIRYSAKLFERSPGSARARLARAAQLERFGKFREAARIVEDVNGERHGDAELLKRAGDLRYLAGEVDRAAARFRDSLALDPSQHELRAFLRRIANQPRFPECRAFQLDALAEVATFQERPEDDAAPSTLVLDQMIIRVYPDASQMEETFQLRRLNDRRGVERYEQADAAADADELLQLRTITPDGSSYAPHRVAGTFSMPRLAPGVFIEEHYRNYKASPGLQPIDFVRFFFRGVDSPYRMSRLVVILPKEHDLGHFVRRNFPEADVTTRDLDDLTAYVFLKKDQPKIAKEVRMPPIEELAPWVTFGKERDLAPFVRHQRVAFDQVSYPFLEVQSKAAEICKGLETDQQKAKAIHDFVHALTPDPEVRAGSPMPVSVLLKREGDRFPLQIALLRAAGIRWTPVLIHPVPPELDTDSAPFASSAAFWSRRGVLVHPRNAPAYWIIAGTPRYHPFGVLPAQIGRNPLGRCPYLLLQGNAGTPGVMPSGPLESLASVSVRARVTLKGADAHMTATLTFQGNQGYTIKERIRPLNKNRRQLVGGQLARVFFPGFRMRRIEYLGLERKGTRLACRIQLVRGQAVAVRGEDRALPLLMPPSRLMQVFGGRGDRTHPILYQSYFVTDWGLDIDPGELRFAELPKGLVLHRQLIAYGLTFAFEGKELRVRRALALEPGRIQPDRYKEFLDLCKRIDDKESQRIRLLRR